MKFQDSNFFVFTHLCKINEKYSQVKVGTSSKNKKTHALSAATGVPPLFNLAKCRHCYWRIKFVKICVCVIFTVPYLYWFIFRSFREVPT